MTLNYSDHREWTIKLLAYKYHVNNDEIERCIDTNTDNEYKQKLIADNILIDAEIKKRDHHILGSKTSSIEAEAPLSGPTHSDTFKCSVIQSTATALANKLFDKYFSKSMDVVNVGAAPNVDMGKPCPTCKKTAYPRESLIFNDEKYHKLCFKCRSCSNNLTLQNATSNGKDKLPYCKTCYNKIITKTRTSF
jgi:hypothetical protein